MYGSKKPEAKTIGTNTSRTETSWLPVPRRPPTVQVSMISHWLAGSSMKRSSGPPDGVIRGLPLSCTTDHRTIQLASWQPLTSGQRPVRRKPPSTICALPEGRVLLAVMTCGSSWMACAASGES